MKMHTLLVAVAVAAVLAGCQRTSFGGLNTQQQPAPLMPAPVGGVQSGQLAPPTTPQPGEFPVAPTTPETTTAPQVLQQMRPS